MSTAYILDGVIFLPFVFAAIVAFLPAVQEKLLKVVAVTGMLVTFFLSLLLLRWFDADVAGFQFLHRSVWIQRFDISYFVGVDGMSLLLILLTTFLTPLALLGTWNSIQTRLKEYLVMMLFLETGMIGVFAALDVFLFYVFWEAMLIPMYFIIGIWGGGNRIYAALKFFLYTLFGSLLMLVAILAVGAFIATLPGRTFTMNLLEWYNVAPAFPATFQMWLFLAFGISFAIKVPLWPFHTWLPDAHVEAPTAGSVLLAGVLLKMGTYGFVRFNLPLFPQAALTFVPFLSTLAVIGIVYGALVAMVQKDMKKLVAYSSVSHLGFVMLGVFSMSADGLQGAILQMVNHGLSTGALFLLVGMLYDRTHTRMIAEYGGYAKIVPVFATLFLIISLSSIGLPGLNGFVGEFLILLGAFTSSVAGTKVFAIVAATGVILAAVYMLWMIQRVFFGPLQLREGAHSLPDMSAREIGVLAFIVLFVVWIGIYPKPFLKISAGTAQRTVERIEEVQQGQRIQFSLKEIEKP